MPSLAIDLGVREAKYDRPGHVRIAGTPIAAQLTVGLETSCSLCKGGEVELHGTVRDGDRRLAARDASRRCRLRRSTALTRPWPSAAAMPTEMWRIAASTQNVILALTVTPPVSTTTSGVIFF